MKRKALASLVCAALTAATLFGCTGGTTPSASTAPASGTPAPASSSSTSSAAASEAPSAASGDTVTASKPYKMGFIVGSREHVFYNLIETSITETAKAAGIEAMVFDGELDANVQSNHIQNLIAMQVDAIALATVDAGGVGPAIEAANKAGIPVFTFDSPCNTVDVIKCHAGTDNVEGGRLGAREVLRLVPKGSTVAMIGMPSSSSVLDRQAGFEEVMKAQSDVEYKFFGNYEGDANIAATLMQDWLTADPKLAAVFCAGDPAASGALASIKAAGASTLIVGFDGNPEAITAIKDQAGDGKWWVSEISQNPKLIGKTIVEQMIQFLDTGSVDAALIPISPYVIDYAYTQQNGL